MKWLILLPIGCMGWATGALTASEHPRMALITFLFMLVWCGEFADEVARTAE